MSDAKSKETDAEREREPIPRTHKCYGCIWKTCAGDGVIVCAFSTCCRRGLQKWVDRMKGFG